MNKKIARLFMFFMMWLSIYIYLYTVFSLERLLEKRLCYYCFYYDSNGCYTLFLYNLNNQTNSNALC